MEHLGSLLPRPFAKCPQMARCLVKQRDGTRDGYRSPGGMPLIGAENFA